MNFQFPLDAQPFQYIADKTQLKDLLLIFLNKEKLLKFCKYRFLTCKKYLYAKCLYCTAEFRFKKQNNDESYKLWKLKNEHIHTKKNVLTYLVKEAIQQIPEQIQLKTVRYLIQKRFNISVSYFYRIYNKVRNYKYPFSSLIDRFRQQGLISYFQPVQLEESSFPSIYLGSSVTMKKAFEEYGQFCCLDFTYNLIRQKSSENSQFRVGAFVGISNMMKIIPFALIIIDNEEKQTIAKVIYQFFKMMGKQPKTIITDEQKSIIGALKLLKYQNSWDGQHLFDSFHILQKTRHSLSDKKKIYIFKDLMKAENRPQYEALYQQHYDQLNEHDKGVLERFRKDQKKYCFSQVPKNFIGFGVSSSISEKLNDLIKSKIPFSQNYTILLKKTLYFLNNISFRISQPVFEKSKIQTYFDLQELKILRFYLGKNAFKKLIEQISKSISCQLSSDEIGYLVIDKTGEFQIRKNEESNLIDCSCLFLQKTGIPCKHILKILILGGKRIKDYINKRWKVKIVKLKQTKIPKSRNTRRNRKK